MPTHVVSFDSLSEVLASCFHDRDWYFEIISHTDKNSYCFCQYANYLSFPSHWNILTFVRYALFHFIQFLWKHNSFMWIFAFRRKNLKETLRFQPQRYVSISLHFHLYANYPSLETKMSPLISQMLAFLGTLFISRFFKLHFRLFIPTF